MSVKNKNKMKFRFSKIKYLLAILIILTTFVGGLFFYVSKIQPQYAKASIFNTNQNITNPEPTPPSRLLNKQTDSPIIPDQYIVKFKAGTDTNSDLNLKNTQNEKLEIDKKLTEDTFLLKNPQNTLSNISLSDLVEAQSVEQADIKAETKVTTDTVKELSKSPQIESIEPNTIIHTEFTPNDPLFSTQWHLENTGQNGGTLGKDIKAKQAFDITQVSPNVIVAVIDTGVDLIHADLVDNLARNGSNQVIGFDFANNDNDPTDDEGHGTHIAGIIAAKGNNSLGVTGVCPNCKIMPIKFLDNTGNGSTANAISALNFAIANGAKVINLSWGSNSYSSSLQNVINTAYNSGIVVVASAGNDNVTDFQFPSDMAHVVSVAATDRLDRKAFYSNYNDRITVSAPGSDILSTFPAGSNLGGSCGDNTLAPSNDGYGYCTGTSMASPVAAGVAALVASQNPSYTPDQIAATLINTSDNINNLNPNYVGLLGGGRVNAYRALTEVPKPNFTYLGANISDTAGNNNSVAEAGETINFNPDIQNLGASATSVIAVLSTSDSDINITQNSASLGSLNFAQNQVGLFTLSLNSGAIFPKTVNFSLNISSLGFTDQVVNFSYTFKPALDLPLNYNLNTDYTDWTPTGIWKISNSCFSGTNLGIPKYFHFGKDSCGDYDFNLRMTGNLYSQPIKQQSVGQQVKLSFDQFLETENVPVSYDKATVKIKKFGAADSTATTLITAQTNTTTWVNKIVDLPLNITSTGLFQIFFSFDSVDAGNNNYKGWFVDNINLSLSSALSSADIPNLNLICDTANYNNNTTCRFDLPTNKTLPAGFKIQILNALISVDCILDAIPTKVICNNVPTPNSIGMIPVSAYLDNILIDTTKTSRINGQELSKADFTFTPDQGSVSPIFLSSDPVTVKINEYKNVFDQNPQNGSYICNFDFGTLGTRYVSSPIWTSFGLNIPYDQTNGCQTDLTKIQRGNLLNLDLRVQVCPVATPTLNCSLFYSQYIYRFQGAGVATGG